MITEIALLGGQRFEDGVIAFGGDLSLLVGDNEVCNGRLAAIGVPDYSRAALRKWSA